MKLARTRGSKSRIALVGVHVDIDIVESVVVDIAVNVYIAIDINITIDINIAIDNNIDIDIAIVVNVDIQGRRGGERAGRDGGHAHEDPPPAESRALRFPL